MIDEPALGGVIREYRIQEGLSLQELARRSGITKGYLSKIEKAKKAPSVSTLSSWKER